jgi:putative intracellular protease/amidase
MTAPYYEFAAGGMKVDLASINGGPIPIDPMSFKWFIKSAYDDRFLKDSEFLRKTGQSLKIDDVDFTGYDIIYLAGGWGAAYDLGTSAVLGRKISEAYKAGKIIGGVCHGPLGLLLANDEKGAPLVKGRHMTAVTDKQVGELKITMTPQHPERELRAAGALFEGKTAFRDMFANHSVVDGRLVTGQNQNAGPEVAHKMMAAAKGGLK